EFASMIPVAGSAYTYGYATLGEIVAWIIGWDLILEYALGAATVASGWSGYVLSFLQDFGVRLTPKLAGTPGMKFVFYQGHWSDAVANWHPFIPPNSGSYGNFGLSGIATAAGVIFFAYIGFDCVSTAAQEAKNPAKDMPIGILGSLVICTILYILVAGVLTGLVSYRLLDVPDPIAVGIDVTGVRWGSFLVKLGAICGLSSTMLVMLLGQSRVFFSMSKDR